MYIILFTLLCLIFGLVFLFSWKKQYPKQFKKVPKVIVKHTTDVERDGFSKKKIPHNIDCIVIGSGIGGLTTAGLLSRVGKKVLVLEQHYIAGGSTHCFEDGGFEFDTGIHYVGNISSRERILKLITNKDVKWLALGYDNNKIYDKLAIGDDIYNFQQGRKTMINYLSELFPEEAKNIEKYITFVKKVAKMELFFLLKIVKPVWLARIISYYCCNEFHTLANKSVKKVLDEYFTNDRLKAIIGGLSIDGGPPPSEQSFFIHASILNHFIEGGYYPLCGCGVIAKNIIPIIEEAGGRVLVRAPVEQIIIEDGEACGVIVKGNKIYAKTIISNAGIRNTYHKLLPNCIGKNYFDDVLSSIPSELSYNFLFVGLKGTKEELGLNSSNIYLWPENSFDEAVKKYESDPFSGKHLPPMFIASSSAKDILYNERFPNKSTVCVISWSKTNMFNTQNVPRKRKDENYLQKKKKVQDLMWKALFKHFPLCKDKVVYSSTSTSESVKHYLGSYNGECYGLDATTNRFNYFKMKPKTNIPNLYLTGQDIVTSGFAGAITAGILTASDILGYGTLLDIATGRDLIKDLERMSL